MKGLKLTVLEQAAAGGLLLVGSFVVFAEVVLRYFFGYSSAIVNTLLEYAVAWSALIGGSLAVAQRIHITVDVVVTRLPARAQSVVRAVSGSLGVLTSLWLAVYGLLLMQNARLLGITTQTIPPLPEWPFEIVLPVTGITMAVHFAELLLRRTPP